MLARYSESIEMVVIPMMKKEIIMEHDDYVWMALYALSAPLPSVVAATIGGYVLPPSASSSTTLMQQVVEFGYP